MYFYINEYSIGNEYDYIYYCSDCHFAQSEGEKVYYHKFSDKREYYKPIRRKEYNFFIRINGSNELDLMHAKITITILYYSEVNII